MSMLTAAVAKHSAVVPRNLHGWTVLCARRVSSIALPADPGMTEAACCGCEASGGVNQIGNGTMSNLHKRAMEAVLEAAEYDVVETLKERDVRDRHSEEGDELVLDVAILHAYRVFVRICERNGVSSDAGMFAELAGELAEDLAHEADQG